MSAKVNLPEPLNKLLRSQLETAIYESALHRDDELIARLMGPTILLPRLLRLHKYISPSSLLSNRHRPFRHRGM